MNGQETPFFRVEGALQCGTFGVQELAERFGTPLFLYSFDFIRARFQVFQDAFSGTDLMLAYSVKANGNLGLLNRLAGLGVGADIVSGGELFRAMKGGIQPGKIVFAGVGKSDEELRAGLDAGIYSFHVETTGELHRLEELARERGGKAPFSVRLNPDIHSPTPHEYTRTGHAETKFGLPVPVAVGLYRWAKTRPHLQIRGIDLHIGSQITDPAPYKRALRSALEVVHLLKKEGILLEYVDLGGGYGIPYEEVGMDIGALAGALAPLMKGTGLKLILEPGRSLVGEAGALVTRVMAVKRSGKKTFVITDAGMTELIRPSHYVGFHGVLPVREEKGRERLRVDVVGPICETGDFLARDRELPLPKPGEFLAVEDAGAYGFVMASNYNARPRPPEVLVDGGEVFLVRERETFDDLVRGEVIP
ncbi:diaminopimelate decarboxylase [Gemmatimonadota bacterium]